MSQRELLAPMRDVRCYNPTKNNIHQLKEAFEQEKKFEKSLCINHHCRTARKYRHTTEDNAILTDFGSYPHLFTIFTHYLHSDEFLLCLLTATKVKPLQMFADNVNIQENFCLTRKSMTISPTNACLPHGRLAYTSRIVSDCVEEGIYLEFEGRLSLQMSR